jgi:Leucine-rich repeat (LRR) protein
LIASLTQLERLILYRNQLTSIPGSIASLTHLTEIDLSNNQLTNIPQAIASLTKLESLYLNGNPLEPELDAVYQQGIDAVFQYLRAKSKHDIF